MTKEELIKRHGIEWYEEYKAKLREFRRNRYANSQEYRDYRNYYNREYYKNNQEFRDKQNEYIKQRYKNNQEYRNKQNEYLKQRYKNNQEYRTYLKEYQRNQLNSNGKTKANIRAQSGQILFKRRKHSKIKGYEIHHCFGYNDPSKFIYIPKTLHRQIHQYLRDNSIDADSNHYNLIKYMLNDCVEYTYISV